MNGIGFIRGMTGRADLLRARRFGDPELEEYVARLLGYRLVAPKPRRIELPAVTIDATMPTAPAPTSAGVTRDIRFWQATHFVIRVRDSSDAVGIAGRMTPGNDERSNKKRLPKPNDLSFLPLASNASLLTRLRGASPTQAISGEIDVDRIVEEWGRGRFLAEMPKSLRKSWGRSVQVFVDRSRRLIPYWEDQTRACLALREIFPPEGFSTVVLPEGRLEPFSMKIGRESVAYQPPPQGSAVVALSDLGVLDQRGPGLVALWAQRGRRLRNLGVKPLAVVPYRLAVCPQELSRYWTILPWESNADADAPALSEEETKTLVGQILTLLSFTLRIEPQLIRFVRRLLSAGRGEPGVESLVWQHEAFGEPDYEAAELSTSEAVSLRLALASQAPELRRQVYERVEASHKAIYEGVWYAEMGNLGLDELIDDDQRREMCEWFESQVHLLESKTSSAEVGPLAAWHREVSERFLKVAYQDRGRLGRALHRLWSIVHRDDPHAVLPDGADLGLLPPESERGIELRQFGDRLIASYSFHDGTLRDGSPLAFIRTSQSRLKIEPLDDFWEGGVAPAWADGWGRDDFGPWVDLRVEKARQRLRWIPPGKFWMGSPEEGRYHDEGPQHEETISSGFWMFDTPCTQLLWEAVMGENPSRFEGRERPVERVSWTQCHEFVKRMNDKCKGLELRLPMEVQWEYACRAGTDTPCYRENLNEIAWHGDNSNAETHPVGQKAPNAWGLFDTLGDVFEWCQDAWSDHDKQMGKAGESRAPAAHRVIRGGSWRDDARFARAAYRSAVGPSYRSGGLGFRCAEFGAPGPVGRDAKPGAERARERGEWRAEHPEDRDQASGAGWINLAAPGPDSVSFAALTPLRISSDIEQVVLRTTTRPEWASAIGRDKYGLWAEFTIEPNAAKATTKRTSRKKKSVTAPPPLGPVRQRLRWIPPGRFLMGSPPDEEGRDSDEGPQHEVTFTEGFWMFDTPCTQALWESLMDENPSYFKSPDRPVDSVAWKDCREFARRLEGKVELLLSLPSEAQWEYACRAGTTTATYAGPLAIKGINNAPILDEIAWYGGNSGIDFDLSSGYDASGWPEKQLEFQRAGTHLVGRRGANPWGLYDMLGNVWEWCEDVWANDYSEKSRAEAAAADPPSAHRVIRGGSWFDDARLVRAAYRGALELSYRNFVLGFRGAEFRQGS